MFNQAAAALGQLPGRISTLDPVLGRSLSERPRAASVGVRVGRELTPRFSAEVRVDYSLAPSRITAANSAVIEATRASFVPAFTGLITFNPNRVLRGVSSTAEIEGGNSRQLVTSGALVVNLRTSGVFVPYATIGAALTSALRSKPSATLRGNYEFLLPGGAPVSETDNVIVADARDNHAIAGILGGGAKYHLSPRWGIRLDVQISLSANDANTDLEATPHVTLGLLPAGRGVLGSDPSIQFSNNSTDPVTALGVTAVAASSLTGPPISALRTYSGKGVVIQTNITAGVFWRF